MALVIVDSGSIGPPSSGPNFGKITSFQRFNLMQPGDLMLVAATALLSPIVDSRLSWLANFNPGQPLLGGGGTRGWALGYWWAPDDVPIDTTPMTVNISDYHPRTYANITWAIIRGVDNIGEFAYTDVYTPLGKFYDVNVHPDPARAAVAIWAKESFGFVPGDVTSSPDWTPIVDKGSGGRASGFLSLWTADGDDPEAISSYGFKVQGSSGGRLRGYVMALNFDDDPPPPDPDPDVLSVVRQTHRDDARGVSSAPRLWPPSKSRRLAGGYPGGSGA